MVFVINFIFYTVFPLIPALTYFQYNISLEVMPKLPTEMSLKRQLKTFRNVTY